MATACRYTPSSGGTKLSSEVGAEPWSSRFADWVVDLEDEAVRHS